MVGERFLMKSEGLRGGHSLPGDGAQLSGSSWAKANAMGTFRPCSFI